MSNTHQIENNMGKGILTRKEGQTIIHKLLPTSDIIVENDKSESLTKRGLDFATLQNYPILVHCHSSIYVI